MRIVSLLASATEILCALGAGDFLVGRSHECDNPPWVKRLPACSAPAFDIHMPSDAIDAEVRRRLRDNEPLYHLDAQLIQQLRPDLLITQAHCEVCAVTPGNVQQSGCATAGAQVLALQAGTIAGVYEGIHNIAAAIGQPHRGHELVARMQADFNHLRAATAHRRRPSVVLLEWTDPLFAMGNWGPELVEFANGQFLLGSPGQHSQAIPWSDLLNADPEFLVIAPCGYDLPRARAELPLLQRNPRWSSLRAVKENKVRFADGNLYFNRSGTTLPYSARLLAQILHGQPFPSPNTLEREAPPLIPTLS